MWWEFTWIGGRREKRVHDALRARERAELKRAPPMWWEFTWLGREEIAAGKRWRGKVLNSLGVPFFTRSKV